MNSPAQAPCISLRMLEPEGHYQLIVRGNWRNHQAMAQADFIARQLDALPRPRHFSFDVVRLGDWGTPLLSLVERLIAFSKPIQATVDISPLPDGVQQLLALCARHQTRKPERTTVAPVDLFERVGRRLKTAQQRLDETLMFIGELVLALLALIRGQARLRKQDVSLLIEDAGPSSLPIVTLISVLVGVILAFVGAVQLEQFGATIYVASLVGLGMAREMGAMMTAIIMAGRTGAAYAAQLGSMQVNEETDALRTMGLSPMEYLVVPRFLAMLLMLPLLTIYSTTLGIFGGAAVSWAMLDISFSQYFSQMIETVELRHYVIGLIKSYLFAMVIAIAGCMRGLNCGRSATAVGTATTQAVVLAIVFIIISDALVTVLTTILGV